VLVLGVVLIVVGWLTGIGIIETIGLVLAVVGALLMIAAGFGHPVGGRNYW
jgi:hypothetical protein